MRLTRFAFAVALLAAAALPLVPASATDVHKLRSKYDVKTTVDRFEKIFKAKGITLFARIDHSAGAASVGMSLPPTELILFGNPKLGTPLMKINREVGYDLPLRALVWQADDGQVWIHITNPSSLNQTYSLGGGNGIIEKMENAVTAIAKKAAGAEE